MERREEGEFILAAMMVVVSELAISEQLPSLFVYRTYLFSSRNVKRLKIIGMLSRIIMSKINRS